MRGAQTMYALGTLKHHGLSGPPMWEVTRATFIARLTYASQAWWGLQDAQGRDRLEKVLNKAVRGGFLSNVNHHLHRFVIQRISRCLVTFPRTPSTSSIICYHLAVRLRVDSEARAHDREMPSANQNTFSRKTFISRKLMLNPY